MFSARFLVFYACCVAHVYAYKVIITLNATTPVSDTLSLACMSAVCSGQKPTMQLCSSDLCGPSGTVFLNATHTSEAYASCTSMSPYFMGTSASDMLLAKVVQCAPLVGKGVAFASFSPSLDQMLLIISPTASTAAPWNRNWQYFILLPAIVLTAVVGAIVFWCVRRRSTDSAGGKADGSEAHQYRPLRI